MLRQETKTWKIRDLIKFSIDLFHKKGIDEARLNTELLLSHALQCPRLSLYTDQERILSSSEFQKYQRLLERRINHEPYQYIIGSANFMGLNMRVDCRVLIPRPETETLVEQTMLFLEEHHSGKSRNILDVGTGSGNVAIALTKLMRGITVFAIDVSEEALEVARLNASVHGVIDHIRFLHMNIFEPIHQFLTEKFDVVVSNPPYVSALEWESLQTEIRRYEPRSAVCDGKDGFEFHRRLIEIAPFLLTDRGALILEVGFGQAEIVAQMMEDQNLSSIQIHPDLSGVPRVVIGQRNPGHIS